MIYACIGFLAGIISGMGIGGGTVLIPALIIFQNLPQQQAQFINLIYFIPTAIVALIHHVQQKKIETKIAWPLILFGLSGAIIGSLIALRLNSELLRKIFAFFLLGMGIIEYKKK